MTFDYDEDDDILYVTFSSPKGKVRYAETAKGDIIRYSAETNEIVGITVMYLALRTRNGEKIEVPEVGVVAFSSVLSEVLNRKLVHGKTH